MANSVDLLKILDEVQNSKGGKNARKRKEIAMQLQQVPVSDVTVQSTSNTDAWEKCDVKETIVENSVAEAEANVIDAKADKGIILTYEGEELTETNADEVLSTDIDNITCTLVYLLIREANNYNLGDVAIPKRLMCSMCGCKLQDYIEFEKEVEAAVKIVSELKFEYEIQDENGSKETGYYYLIFNDAYEDTDYIVLNVSKDLLEYNLPENVSEAWEVFNDFIDDKTLISDKEGD